MSEDETMDAIEAKVELLTQIEAVVEASELVFHGQYNRLCREITRLMRDLMEEEDER